MSETDTSTLSPDQRNAVDAVAEWYKRVPKHRGASTIHTVQPKGHNHYAKLFQGMAAAPKSTEPIPVAQSFLLSGFAGSGKTFIIPYIVKACGLDAVKNVVYCAFTGKAAVVMKQKHEVKATTIHHLIYQPKVLVNKVTKKKELRFFKVSLLPDNTQLIIVDEASMVPKEVHRDLASFGVPILYIGDHFQLPPVKQEDSVFAMFPIGFKLETIHRQAEGNPILRLSAMLRDGSMLAEGSYEGKLLKTSNIDDLGVESFMAADQVICGYNNTRTGLNEVFRKWRGCDGLPKDQEKLIILRNNHEAGLMNGQQVVLRGDAQPDIQKHLLKAQYVDMWDLRDAVSMLCAEFPDGTFYRPMFEGGEMPSDLKKIDNKILYADYAYVITCHKCVDENSWLFTSSGLRRIKELWNNSKENGRLQEASIDLQTKDGVNTAIQIFKGDKETGIDIHTSRGYHLTGSERHPVYVYDAESEEFSWRLLPETKVGDTIVIERGSNLFAPTQFVSSYVPSSFRKKAKACNVLDEDTALLLGFLVGDGNYNDQSDYRIDLTNADEEVFIHYIRILQDKFEVGGRFLKKKSNARSYMLMSKIVRESLFHFGLEYVSRENKSIPFGVLQSPKVVQCAFLRGLFDTDGCCRKGRVTLVNKSPLVIDLTRLILLNMGIVSSTNTSVIKGVTYYYLSVYGASNLILFRNNVNFNITRKSNRLSSYLSSISARREKTNLDYLPFRKTITKLMEDISKALGKTKGIKGKGLSSVLSNKCYYAMRAIVKGRISPSYWHVERLLEEIRSSFTFAVEFESYKKLKFVFEKRFFFDTIVSKESKEAQMYDLHIPEVENFVSNGLISHNSQGSEWESVLLYDDGFGRANGDEMRQRWLYTAVTRASDRLIWLRTY